MKIDFRPVSLVLDDEARLVEIDGRLLAVITLHDAQDVGSSVHVEAYFHGDAPDTFDSLEAMEFWIRSNYGRIG